jgi:hypothetical protein
MYDYGRTLLLRINEISRPNSGKTLPDMPHPFRWQISPKTSISMQCHIDSDFECSNYPV